MLSESEGAMSAHSDFLSGRRLQNDESENMITLNKREQPFHMLDVRQEITFSD